MDGIHSMVHRDRMGLGVRKMRDTYDIKADAPFFQEEFGFINSLERWREQGMPADVPTAELFSFDEPGRFSLGGLGWCEAGFVPTFEEKVLEDRGDYELAQDFAGRHVLFFKGRRNGFMPEYLDHPVKDQRTWEEQCLWRMNPETPERLGAVERLIPDAVQAAAEGKLIVQQVVGGYMYLRSLIGPVDVLYMFYDQPDLVHACMRTWLDLADSIIARYQEHVTIDEFYIGEDICYNHGPLISPEMIKEFILPYYRQLLDNIRSRQIDKSRHLYFHVDTDGYANAVIPLYRELGMDVMSPFEVASGCDVVEIGKQYPDLVMSGGVDKRVLAQGKDAIDKLVDSIFPAMRRRGGYIPTCDHGVPVEVSYENYLHYRKRCLEFAE